MAILSHITMWLVWLIMSFNVSEFCGVIGILYCFVLSADMYWWPELPDATVYWYFMVGIKLCGSRWTLSNCPFNCNNNSVTNWLLSRNSLVLRNSNSYMHNNLNNDVMYWHWLLYKCTWLRWYYLEHSTFKFMHGSIGIGASILRMN